MKEDANKMLLRALQVALAPEGVLKHSSFVILPLLQHRYQLASADSDASGCPLPGEL